MKMAWTSRWFRSLVLVVTSFLPAGILWPAGSASGQPPLFQGSLACPADALPGAQVAQDLLDSLSDPRNGDPLNSAWLKVEPNIEKLSIEKRDIHVQDGCANGGSAFCTTKGLGCSFVFVDTQVQTITGLNALRFVELGLPVGTVNGVPQLVVDQRNVAAHTNRGPDASVITDGVFGPESSNAAEPAYAVVLPGSTPSEHNGVLGAIVIELGSKPDGTPFTVCGVAPTCNAPKLQADNDDVYQIDYSTDGINWTTNAALQFPTRSGSGLYTRSLTNSKAPANFQARYVRVYGVPGTGGNNWSVSELQLWDTSNNLISAGKPAIGPISYQLFDGQLGPTSGDSANANYSVVLPHKTGSAVGLMIDLGQVRHICGNNGSCPHPPRIQADNDDIYMFDYSVDGKNWTTYGWVATATADQTHGDWHGTFQNVGGEGLQQRDMTCPTPTSTDPPLPTPCNPPTSNPGFRAQYIRVYTRDGGNTFAVSELMLWDTAGNPVPTTRLGYGPEPSFINGEFAPEGTSWNDTHWVTKLGACSSNGSLLNPNSKCPAAAPGVAAPISAAKQIDLTAVFPISQIIIQAESSNTYQVDGSLDGTSWTHLWTVPVGSGGGMRTRQPKVFTGTLPQARYVRVYATAGSNGEYSVSELQVFTPQANTAGAYGTVEDSDGFFSSRGANDGQNFVCSYEGPITTALGVVSPDNGSVQSFGTLPIQFYVVYVSLNAHCSDGNNYNIAAAHDRQCSMTLVPPPSLAPPFTDHFQAGLCGGTNAPAILSYLQFDDDPESGSNSAVQFASKDQPVPYPSGHPSDLDCTDFSSLDAHIPDVLRGVVPGIVAGATRQAMNEVLDYRANQLIPFPRVPGTTPGQTVPVTCPTTGEEEPPTPAPDNIRTLSGHATGVGGDRGRATLRVSGRFTAEHAVALDQAALTVHSLLDEAGVGDTVQGVLLLTLQPSNGSKADKGLYHTPTGARPIVSARVAPGKGSRDGSMDFEIEVKNATIREPVPCRDGLATAPLRTSFQLVGGSAEPIWVHAETEWQCNDTQLLTP